MQPTNWTGVAAFLRVGWHRSRADKTTTIGIALLYWLILGIFWGLWQATSLVEMLRADTTPRDLFWYLVVTECIAMAVGYPYRFVETEINNGDIASGLMRPIPYALATLADWAGQTAYHVLVLSVAGGIAGIFVTGSVPISIATLPILFLSAAIGCVSALLCQLQIGYSATWIGSSAPVFWIWQKLFFVLGGLMIPLTLYPTVLRSLAKAMPFASMLYAPGSLASDASLANIAKTLSMQCAWLIVLAGITWIIDRAAMARFALRGI